MDDNKDGVGHVFILRVYRYTDEEKKDLGDNPKAVKEYMLNCIRERLDKDKADSIMEWVSQCTKGQIYMIKHMVEDGIDIEEYKEDFVNGFM